MLWPEARRSPQCRYRRRDPDPLRRHPRHRSAARRFFEAVQEARAALERDLRQRPGRGDDGQGVRGHAGECVGQHLDGVPSQQQRRDRRRQRHLRLEPRDPLGLIRRETGAQPSGVLRVDHVDRIRVDADPGDDLGHLARGDGPVSHDRRHHLHGRGHVAQRLSVAVGDADAIDVEVEPRRAAHVDQPDRTRPDPPRRLGDGRVQHGAASGLVGPRTPAHRDGHDRVGHPQQRVDRGAGRGFAIGSGIRRGERRGASGESEVVQRGEDDRGVPLARRRGFDRAQRLVGLTQGDGDALVQRRCSGGVDLAEASVALSEGAGPAHGQGGLVRQLDSTHEPTLMAASVRNCRTDLHGRTGIVVPPA